MKKKNLFILIIIIAIVLVGFWLINRFSGSKTANDFQSQSQCQVKEMIFYYRNQCGWCQRIKSEGTVDKLKKLGVEIKEIDASIGPIRHQFEGVPTFVINDKVYTGYKTFEELTELLSCQKTKKQAVENQNQPQPISDIQFLGDKGESVNLENNELKLAVSSFSNSQARFYNIKMPDKKTIYFFVLKDKQGIYRAAANACQVCFKTYKGFRQEGDEIVCNNCGNRYPIEKIATEKGGCNPGPINPNLEIKNGQIIIKQADLEQVSDLF